MQPIVFYVHGVLQQMIYKNALGALNPTTPSDFKLSSPTDTEET